MLTLPEKIIFILAAFATLYAAWQISDRIVRTIRRGHGKVDWDVARKRLLSVLALTISFQPVFRFRFWTSLLHGFVGWAFIYYFLVNLGDVYEAFFEGSHFLGTGLIGDLYRLGADLLSVLALFGMAALMVRRFVFQPPTLNTRNEVLLQPEARRGIRRDSAIVSSFILVHVGSRFLGRSFELAESGADVWEPFASLVSGAWQGFSPFGITLGQHLFFWLALGTIMLFIPYFLYSKHIHLFFAPINFLLKPERPSMGKLDKLDFEDETIEEFGAKRIEDLGWEQIVDAYACIMCYRCQQVCPAYNTGKVLSPAAMEINKRYLLNKEGDRLAKGEASQHILWEYAIPPEAIWACTACGACVDICPVGNEPMRDILDIRRALVLVENEFPDKLQTAFRGMERAVNPWNIPQTERMKWAEGFSVPTIEQNPEPELLWWVGCAPATDARAQKTARAFAQILNLSGISYAVLGRNEQCNGDSARRAGNEFLFNELATANVEILNEVNPPRIVTTCPHCLHVLKNEYRDFGGNYNVIHHTQLINELLSSGKLGVQQQSDGKVTYHDPCYLGRQNGVFEAPRESLNQAITNFIEMERKGRQSFCCGAGGAQMWKEEEEGDEGVNQNRFREAQEMGVEKLAVGCPFCMVMLTDAGRAAGSNIQVVDIAEVVLESVEKKP